LSARSHSSAFVSRAIISIGGVAVLIIGLTIAMLIGIANEANWRAAEQQLERLENAFRKEQRRTLLETATLASGRSERFSASYDALATLPPEQLITAGWQLMGFGSFYMLDASGMVLFGAENGVPAGAPGFRALEPLIVHIMRDAYRARLDAERRNAAHLSSPGFERSHAASGLVHNGQSLAIVTAVPINPATRRIGGPDLFIALRELNDQDIAAMAGAQGLRGLRFTAIPVFGGPSLPVRDATGETIGSLVWEVERPGSEMLPRLLLIALISVLALALNVLILFRKLRSLAMQFAQDEERSRRLASHDHLSGLLNRRSFGDRMAQELERIARNGGAFALHLIDLDKFKEVNDTLGHQAGDEVIRQTAKRLSGLVRGADIVARLGGDEFAILQVEIGTAQDAASLAARIRTAVNEPILIGGAEAHVGCSIGIAMAPENSNDGHELMKLADSALYEAKNDGRNRFRFFEQKIDQALKMKQLVEDELRDAIANDQLELHYQPQVSADSARIIGLEALVRWRHPKRGLIPPAEFISLAEERGLIVPLSNWVLRRALSDGKRWPGLTMAVNVSAAQFKHHNFVSGLLGLIEETGFEPSRLELELTEGMIVDDEQKAEDAIYGLRGHGIRLALDDFGTGYSSLIYLRRFSFDKIKIDRSFLEYMEATGESAILVHSVVHLGRALGLTVCAEGVETDEQRRFLQAVGCHELQGYLFSRPLPADQIDGLLGKDDPFSQAA
jgi:diguanylate cyclase (GGDEF)-like protein